MSPIREDFAGQRQLRFRAQGKMLHLFKQKGESTHQVYLKVLTYALYGEQYELEIDPRVDCKYQPHVASLDLTGEVSFWAHCGEISLDQITYVLKHSAAEEVVLVREHNALMLPGYRQADLADFDELDLEPMAAYLKRHIHYRYTKGKLRMVVFRGLDEWFQPDDVEVENRNFHLYAF